MTDETEWRARAFDAAPGVLLVVDVAGQIVFANGSARRMFERPDLVGARFETLVFPGDRGMLAEPPERTRCEVHGLDAAGRAFPIEIEVGGIDGTSMSVVAIRDLGEQRQVEATRAAASAAAIEASERLEAMLDCAPAFIIAVGADHKIEFINRVLPQYTKEQVIGMHWLSFFPPEQQAKMEQQSRRMYETETTQFFETITPGPDGQPLTFDSQIAPIRSQGEIVGSVLVSRDITERKRAEAELLASRHMALLGALAAGVAHEINTPIQFVKDSVEFLSGAATDLLAMIETKQRLGVNAAAGADLAQLLEEAAAAEARADLPYVRENMPPAFARCLDGLKQISKIVRSLKDFAHPSSEEMTAVDLNVVVENAVTIAKNEYKLVADLQLDLGEIPPTFCHATEISQVVLNIVVNAAHAIAEVVKSTGRKGAITVSTRAEGGSAVIAISDTGTGIPDSIRSRIFDPFFTTKEVGKGTGQGLSIAWSMVKERHGGELTFESAIGKGTTFFIRLPITAASVASAA